MKTKVVWMIGLLGWALFIFSALSTVLGQSTTDCTMRFAAYGNSGLRNQPLLAGELQLAFGPSGTVSGQLRLDNSVTGDEDAPMIAEVVGQANGHAINLVFSRVIIAPDNMQILVDSSADIFAVGTAHERAEDCAGLWAGSFVSPENRNSGEWFAEA